MLSLRVKGGNIKIPGDCVRLPKESGEVSCEHSGLGGMSNMCLTGRVHNELDLVSAQALGGTGMEKLRVGISFTDEPKLPTLLPVCGVLLYIEG